MFEAVFNHVIEIQAWEVVHPKLESSKIASMLRQEVNTITNMEEDQGVSTLTASTFTNPLSSFVS
jgi:hypothetical protein